MHEFFKKYPVGTAVYYTFAGKTERCLITDHAFLEGNKGYHYGLIFHNAVHKMPTYFNEKGEGVMHGATIKPALNGH